MFVKLDKGANFIAFMIILYLIKLLVLMTSKLILYTLIMSIISRPMQRKLIILVTSQLLNDEGRTKGARAAR